MENSSRMEIPDHLTCLLRNPYAGQEATVRTRHGTMAWFKTGKGVCHGFVLSPHLSKFYADYSMWNAGLDESQAGTKISREKYQQPQICRWYHSNGREWRGTKELLDEGARKGWKSWLKTQQSKNEDHGNQFHHFIANRRGKTENSNRFYFLGLQNHCRWWLQPWIKRCLFLARKAMTNLDSVLKSRYITLLTKVCLVKAMVYPVVMYGCERWTIKKAEQWRTDAFKLWCWRRLLRVPWTERRSDQLILKDISPEYSLEGLMLKLKLQYFGHLMWRPNSLENTLMLGKIDGRSGWQRVRYLMASLTQWTWVWANSRR